MSKDNFIRKPIVFNRNSAWHMEIYNRITSESDNFSGYVMGILKGHFDVKPKIKHSILEKEKTKVELPQNKVNESDLILNFNGKEVKPKVTPPKLFKPK